MAVTALLTVLLCFATFAWWFDDAVVNSENFVGSTVRAFAEGTSRDAAGHLIVERLVERYPLLVVLEPNLVDMFVDLLDTPEVGVVISVVTADIHEQIMSGSREAVVVSLVDHRDSILAPIEADAPSLARVIPSSWFVSIEIVEAGELPDFSPYATWVEIVRVVTFLAAVLLVATLLWLVRRRGRALTLIGAAFVAAAFVARILVPAGRTIVAQGIERSHIATIAINLYDEFTRSLFLRAALLAGVGTVLIVFGVALWLALDERDRAAARERQGIA